MPYAPRKRCGRSQCKEFVEHGSRYCATHQAEVRQITEARRGGRSDDLYHTSRWKRLASLVMMQEPLCRTCKTAESKVIDHIIPIKQGGDRLRRENLQGLCWKCHAIKSSKEKDYYAQK